MTAASAVRVALEAFSKDRPPVKGFILDITGVLYNSQEGTDGIPIPSSVDAVKRLALLPGVLIRAEAGVFALP